MSVATPCAVRFREIELKLALPCVDPSTLERLLSRLPLLSRRRATRERLHNTYYDTPNGMLSQQRVALRIRRLGNDDQPVWLQTLKTGGSGESALSQRGEWEAAVQGAALEWGMLQATPWPQLDPDGALFQSLAARFTTDFIRTRWTVRNHLDGSVVEIALDQGHILSGGHSAPICELELELKAGQPPALFEMARQIASAVAVLPLGVSKSQRGFALADNAQDQPTRARPPALASETPVDEAAHRVLHEILHHFNANLHTLLTSDDPEVVHQARVAWRRLKTALALFKKTALVQAAPVLQALDPLLKELGKLRDLEVANLQTLPMLANAYVAGSPKRKAHWQALQEAMASATQGQHQRVRQTLFDPAAGATLLALTEWLEITGTTSNQPANDSAIQTQDLRAWARLRMERLQTQLKASQKKTKKSDHLHRTRILAKRLRYGVETLRAVLPKRRAQQWHRRAALLQNAMGAERDLQQALRLAKRLKAHATLLVFLRAVALGRNHPR
jgi:inorganic triphosphatase YgiF